MHGAPSSNVFIMYKYSQIRRGGLGGWVGWGGGEDWVGGRVGRGGGEDWVGLVWVWGGFWVEKNQTDIKTHILIPFVSMK
jgi:hypothetical protein